MIDISISSAFVFRVNSRVVQIALIVTSVWHGVLLYPQCMSMLGSIAQPYGHYNSVLHIEHFCATCVDEEV